MIEKIVSSPEGSPTKGSEIATPKQASPVVGSKQASIESSPPQPSKSLRTPSSRAGSKRKAPSKHSSKQGPTVKPAEEPKSERAKTSSLPSPNLSKFFQRSVVRGKIVKVAYFREQGLEVFLDKLRSHRWLDLFTNTQLGCSAPELVEFYARV